MKREAINLGYRLTSDTVMIEEKRAYEFHFSKLKVIRRFFHFGKALFALKDDCKFSNEYREDKYMKSWFQSFNAFMLLSSDQV